MAEKGGLRAREPIPTSLDSEHHRNSPDFWNHWNHSGNKGPARQGREGPQVGGVNA